MDSWNYSSIQFFYKVNYKLLRTESIHLLICPSSFSVMNVRTKNLLQTFDDFFFPICYCQGDICIGKVLESQQLGSSTPIPLNTKLVS